MTGYSRVETQEAGFTLTVSIRGTNHRFLDAQFRLPSSLDPLESAVRKLVKEHVARGHVEVTVGLASLGSAELEIDRKLLAAYLKGYQTLKQEFVAAADPDLMSLLHVPGLIVSGNGKITPEQLEPIRRALERSVAQALKELNVMRAREGDALEHDLKARLAKLEALRISISKLAEKAPQFYQKRLEGRIRELAGTVEMDTTRLAQEVAFLASRSDIAEELTRFQSHLDQIRRLLGETSEVGKKLDFLLQEMNREANTLLSKTTDVPEVGLEITRQAIEMKTEIEKLREQAQNIE